MKINLQKNEICEALQQYISGRGISLEGMAVSIKFTAGRGDTGISADMDITSTPPCPVTNSKPKAVKATPPPPPAATEAAGDPVSEDLASEPQKSLFSPS